MKPMMRILLILITLSALTTKSVMAADVSEIKTKYPHLFVLKANRKYAGATVEIYYSNGDLVTTQKIEKRRMVIDFCDTKYGEYTIRVVKGNEKKEFQYIKK
jgi:hypothetical protein